MKQCILAISLFIHTTLFSQHTFSIVAIDVLTGEVGSAGASCIANSVIISDVHPGVGAIHTQAAYLPGNQNYAENLMDMGSSPQDIIDSVQINDVTGDPEIRQYGVVDLVDGGRSAAFTGTDASDWKGHIVGPAYAIQGNILLGPEIINDMETSFNNTDGNLACKLMAALQGANVPGADTRCLADSISALSSFLKVAKPDDTETELWLNLEVRDVEGKGIDPIDSLQTLFDLIGGCDYTGLENFHSSVKQTIIFPQPASGYIVFNLDQHFIAITIYTLNGELIFSENVENKNSIIVDIQNWMNGVYLYTLNGNTVSGSGKIIVQ